MSGKNPEKKTLGPLLTLKKGKKPKTQSPVKEKGMQPYVDIKAFETGVTGNYTDDDKCVPCNDGDLLIVCDGSRSGYVGRAIKGYTGSTLAKISAEGVDNSYLYYFIQSMYRLLNTQMKGTGTPHLNVEVLRKAELVIPSISEQKRIVNKIEELFSELDSAVETLKKAKEQLAVYRQSVLECAFEGEYTIDWRKQNKYSVSEFKKELYKKRCDARNTSEYQLMEEISLPSIPKGWDWVFVGDIVTSPEYGTSKKSLKNGEVPVLRMGNMKNGSIDWDDLVYSNDEEDNKKYRLHDQDVLFNRTNSPEHVGKTSIFKGEQEAIFAGYIIRINQLPEINAQYLTYYMNSHTAKKYSNKVKTDGVNQSNINGKKLLSYPFPLCTRGEQDKIVDEIEIRLSKCDSIEKTVNDALTQANAMRQSILKKAFDGSL